MGLLIFEATPHVVGATVLALSVNPTLTPAELKEAILHAVWILCPL